MSVANPFKLHTGAREIRRILLRSHPDMFSWVYAIQAGEDGPIKIGIADDPCARIRTLQQGNPEDLRGLAAWWTLKDEEKWLHEDYAYARIRGEWFRPVPELVDDVLLRGASFCW